MTGPVDVPAEVARRYRSGLTLDQVAHHFGMTAMPMRHRLIAAGVIMRPRGTVPKGR